MKTKEKMTPAIKEKTAPIKPKKTKDTEIKDVKSYYHGVGRRKKARARVFVSRGNGIFNINGTPYTEYFDTNFDSDRAIKPLHTCSLTGMLDIRVNVYGGGKPAQADAVQLGISRSLLEYNPELRSILRKEGLLTVDSRVKERKKYGQKAARRKFQFVKR